MPSVAEQLRQAREALRLDVYQVAEATKIRTEHIRALEEGDYSRFVAPVYIRGFVRTYASLLKLDVPAVMSDLDAELRATGKFAEPPALSGKARGPLDSLMLQLSRVNWRMTLAVLLVLALGWAAIAGYQAWQRQKRTDPLKRLGPGLYPSNSPRSADYLPLPAGPSRK